ncbi:MAG: ABC transporter substrate-binding protein [Burkholderiales bacterium]|nr:ABC transporter substrate-binding protein [Burkholderiales bacterium]
MRTFAVALACAASLTLPAFAQPSPQKVIRAAYPSAERGFDCAAESDEITGTFCDNFFDSLLQYDHFARPIRLMPRAAAAMPEVRDNGATYIFKIKPGIRFTPDPAFKGRTKELTAADYAYSLKRLIDPVVKAQWSFLMDGKLKGGDELVAEAKKTGKFDYDKPIEGLQTPDKYTLIIKLKEPDWNMLYILAMPPTAAVAREVVEHYGKAFAEHPVGTGPFRLKQWVRSSRIVVEKNPDFREEYFETAGSDDPADQAAIAHLKGKRLPLVDRVEIFIVDEEQPRWLAFLRNEHDFLRPVPETFTGLAVQNGKIAPDLAARGITARPDEVAWLTYAVYNMQDPIVGGYKPENIALRRALSMAYPVHNEIAVLEKGASILMHSYIPPGMAGHVNERAPFLDYNPAGAKALLDMYGYLDRDGDGWREMPDGRPLVIDFAAVPRQKDRQRAELWKLATEAIGIRLTFAKVEKLPDLRRQAQLGKVQMWAYGWIADYPDGENFLQLFWSKSIGGANYSMFNLPEYDRLYEKAKTMPDSPERTELYRKMVHLLWIYSPWTVNFLKQGTILVQPWVIGFKKHPFQHEPWRYLDVDLSKAKAPSKR